MGAYIQVLKMNISKRLFQILVVAGICVQVLSAGIRNTIYFPRYEDQIDALVDYLGTDYKEVYYEIAYEEEINGETFDCINGYVDTGEDVHRLFTYAVSKKGVVSYQLNEDPFSDIEWIKLH